VSRPAVLTPLAQRELQNALRDIAANNQAAARGLNDAVLEAAKLLGARPGIGRTGRYVPQRYRFWSLTRYGFLLVYDATLDPVQIVRVVSMRRDLSRLLGDLPR
jgi:plasmid stabilization system protein ParE